MPETQGTSCDGAVFLAIVAIVVTIMRTFVAWNSMRLQHRKVCLIKLKELKADVLETPGHFRLEYESIFYQLGAAKIHLMVSFWEYIPYCIWLKRIKQTELINKYRNTRNATPKEDSK